MIPADSRVFVLFCFFYALGSSGCHPPTPRLFIPCSFPAQPSIPGLFPVAQECGAGMLSSPWSREGARLAPPSNASSVCRAGNAAPPGAGSHSNSSRHLPPSGQPLASQKSASCGFPWEFRGNSFSSGARAAPRGCRGPPHPSGGDTKAVAEPRRAPGLVWFFLF